MTPYRHIPKDSRPVEFPDVAAVAYLYEYDSIPYAIAYYGKRGKPDWNYRFSSTEQREAQIEYWITGLRRAAEEKAKRAASRRNFDHGIEVGAIILNSWGWEQTNVDFYQVVEIRGKQIVMRPIAAASVEGSTYPHGMADMVVPIPGRFTGDPITKTPQFDGVGYGPSIRFDFGGGCVWDGKPHYRSWYA